MAITTPAREGQGETNGVANDRRTWPYRFDMVPLERLFVDDAYQRPLTSFADEVAAHYDPALVGCLITSERRDGRRKADLAVIDGQTRLHGMKENREVAAPCLIYEGLSREQEAELFADLQTKRRGMATYLRFRAALVAKKPEAVAIASIVTAAGFQLDTVETAYTVKSIGALEWTYRREDGPERLQTVLGIIARAWPEPATEYRTGGDLIRGLATFLEREDRVDHERLVDRLSAVTPRMVRHRANALMEGSGHGSGGRAGYISDAILGIYMGRKRGSSGTSA